MKAGIGYRHRYRDALLADDDRGAQPALLEIMPDHFFGGRDPEATLAALAERYAIVFHDVGMSIGTVDDPHFEPRLERVARLAAIAKPILFGEHLAITRSPSGIDLGHLAPLWLVRETLELVCERVARIQDRLQTRVVLENIAAPFAIPGEYDEPSFLERVTERTGCGLLLDVTNLLYTERHAVTDYPLDAIVQLHLAGGFEHRGRWIDSHDRPVDERAFALLGRVRGAPLEAVVVERDDRLPPLSELVAEARRAIECLQRKEPLRC